MESKRYDGVSKGSRRRADDCRIAYMPEMNERTSTGRSERKISRQPKDSTTQPPNEGPTAGASAQMSDATPIIMPVRSSGACSSTMLNISGSATPVPAPCISRPRSSIAKLSASAPSSVPTKKRMLAVRKRRRIGNRALRNAESGMMTASMRRYPVVIHWTTEMPMSNSVISVGNVTFIAVSMTTPVKDISPAASRESRSLASMRRGK